MLLGGGARPFDRKLSSFPHARVSAAWTIFPRRAPRGPRGIGSVRVHRRDARVPSPGGRSVAHRIRRSLGRGRTRDGNAIPRCGELGVDLFDYGMWGPNRPSGEIADPLIYNTAYRREVLLSVGFRLSLAWIPTRRRSGHCSGHMDIGRLLASDARIMHLNVEHSGP